MSENASIEVLLIANNFNFEDCPFVIQLAPPFTAARERNTLRNTTISQIHNYIIKTKSK